MFSEVQTQALSKLIGVFADGSKSERVALARLEADVREYLSDSLDASLRLVGAGAETVRAHTTLSSLVRVIWKIVPPQLFSAASPDFRALALRATEDEFRSLRNSDKALRNLTVLFKRIRQYSKSGRRASSLDLGLEEHLALLEEQYNRCNHCLFEFTDEYYRYEAEDDVVVASDSPSIDGEVCLSITHRRPELDHIVPLVLGGDSRENWQVLCASCNRGKSDLVSYFFGISGTRSGRMNDLFELTSGKRYAVIAEAKGRHEVTPSLGDKKCYRLFRVKEDAFLNAENLIARYC